MKKFLTLFTVAFAAIALAISCEKIVEEPQNLTPDTPVQGEKVTITVAIPNGLTKVSLTQDSNDADGAIKLAWQDTDKILVINAADASKSEEFSIASIDSEKPYLATFTGNPVEGSTFNILYGAESVSAAKTYNPVFTQSGNASTAHLQFLALLEGVSSYESIEFSQSWASAKGGSFKQNSALRMRLQLPDDVENVKQVSLIAADDIFGGSDRITVSFENAVEPVNHIIAAYAMLPLGDAIETSDCDFDVVVSDDNGVEYKKTFSPGSISFKPGVTNAIKLNKSGFERQSQFAGGTGVEGDPWLLANPSHMLAMKENLLSGETKYFKLIEDIDMDGIDWSPLNDVKNSDNIYDQSIDLDGNNHSISHLDHSLFYVLSGSVYDLTLDNANVTTRGILAEYIQGSGNSVSNVTVSNGFVESGSDNVGGLVGCINNGSDVTATINDCTVSDTNVKGNGVVGGIIGYANALVTVNGCKYTGGTITNSGRYSGGFVASTANKASVFSNCQVEDATVDASSYDGDARVGGFIGQNQTSVIIKGCMVGSPQTMVLVKTGKAGLGADNAVGGSGDDADKPLNSGGFVGVNYGTITKNGNTRCEAYVHITSGNTYGTPLNLGGFAGFGRGTIEYSDAFVNMSDLQGQYIGGFCGHILNNGTKVDNCTITGGTIKGNNYTGGFAGYVENNVIVSNNSVLSGTTVIGQSSAGGFAGCIAAGSISGNTVDAIVQLRGGNGGGFVGALIGGSVQNCSASGSISRIEGSNNVFGGFAGYVKGVDLTKCYSTMTINPDTGHTVGGLIGSLQSANTISKCYFSGSITGASSTGRGGLIGVVDAVAATITDCYTSGTCAGSSGTQIYGGIVGELKAGASVTNCYSTMSFKNCGRVTGGIVGRACSAAWPVNNESNNIISKCIAWNDEITYAGTAGTSASSGAIVGYTSFKNTLSSCYRRSDMVYKNSNSAVGTTCQTSMVDQPDCDGTNWGIDGNRPSGTTPGTSASAQYQAPYYGVAAAASATVSSIAQTLGWSSDVWDFSGELPTLK